MTELQTDPSTAPRRPSRPRPTPRSDFEAIRPPGSTGRRVLLFVLGVGLVMAIIAGAVMFWAMQQVDPGDPGAQIASLTIPPGSGVSEIGALLEEEGVISSAMVFGWYVRWEGEGSNWKAGEYTTFHENSSMADAVEVLDAGPVPPEATSVTLVPGTQLSQQLEAINKAFPQISVDALKLTLASGRVTSKYRPPGEISWEGMLAADTFQFENDATPQSILQALVDHQDEIMEDLGYDRAEALTGHTAWELVTMASLAERETGQPADERGKIIRVIQNRLDDNTPLGIDASILYGLGRTSGGLTRSDLEKDTPYNNRINTGLPPTPIATPSEASLAAAIDPPDGPWIYYVLVSNDPPTHLFTESAKEFQRAKEDSEVEGRVLSRVAAVIGHPIGQSLSPTIFAAAFDATGLDWTYVAFDVEPVDLADALAGVRALGFVGINVTTPHKDAVLDLVDEATVRARTLRAVNCVTVHDGRLVGDSTDGEGFVSSLERDGVLLVGRRVAVLGAGGAARSIIAAAADAGAGEVAVVNRTSERAAAAASLAGAAGRVASIHELGEFDVVVNATSVGFGDSGASPVPSDALGNGQVVVDAVYHPLRTRFLQDAAARGATTFDGLGMLVGQAAVAFERWTGATAPVQAMRAAAAAALPS